MKSSEIISTNNSEAAFKEIRKSKENSPINQENSSNINLQIDETDATPSPIGLGKTEAVVAQVNNTQKPNGQTAESQQDKISSLNTTEKDLITNTTTATYENSIDKKMMDGYSSDAVIESNKSRIFEIPGIMHTLSIRPLEKEMSHGLSLPNMSIVRKNKVRLGVLGYLNNYPYFNTNEKLNIGYGFGTFLNLPVKSMYLNTGIQYEKRIGSFDLTRFTEQVSFSFGRETVRSEFKPSSLHYIVVPLSLSKRFSFGTLEVGVFGSYLFNVRGMMTKRSEGPNPVIMDERMMNVNNEGFTDFNLGLSFAFNKLITKHLAIETKLRYHLKEITDSDFDGVNTYILKENQQLNIQLGIKYYLK